MSASASRSRHRVSQRLGPPCPAALTCSTVTSLATQPSGTRKHANRRGLTTVRLTRRVKHLRSVRYHHQGCACRHHHLVTGASPSITHANSRAAQAEFPRTSRVDMDKLDIWKGCGKGTGPWRAMKLRIGFAVQVSLRRLEAGERQASVVIARVL